MTRWSNRDRGTLPLDFYQASYTEKDVRKYLRDNGVDPDGPQWVSRSEEIRPWTYYKDAVPGLPNLPKPLAVLGIRPKRHICYNNITLTQVLVWVSVIFIVFYYIFHNILKTIF